MKRWGVNQKNRFSIQSSAFEGGIERCGTCDPKSIDASDVVFENDKYWLINRGNRGDGSEQYRTELPEDAMLTNGYYDHEHDGWKTPFEFVNQERIQLIARVCVEANKGFMEAMGLTAAGWQEAAEWQRESSRKSVVFHIEHPYAAVSAQHEAWVRQKLKEGWTYGAVKDDALKTHPSLVPYEQLPKYQPQKDAMFVAIIKALEP